MGKKKERKLKAQKKTLQKLAKGLMKIIGEQNDKLMLKRPLLEKDKPIVPKEEFNLVIGNQKVNTPQGSTANTKPNATMAAITIAPENLWISEILANTNNLKIEQVGKFFMGQLGIRDIRAKELVAAKPETDGKDGKWVIMYIPFEEPATV